MTTDTQVQQISAFRSPWVIGWIGLILTVLTVNLIMVYLAIATNPGLVNEDYYERGQDYEQTLMSRRARAPDWTMRVDVPSPIAVGEMQSIRFFVVDKAGQPVDPDAVTFFAYRPSDASQDFALSMTREGRGRYLARVAFPLIGVWDTLVAVTTGADEHSVSRRIEVSRD